MRTRRAMLGRASFMLGRVLRCAVGILAAVVAAVGIAAGFLVWHLTEGPIVIDFLTPAIEQAFNAPDGRVRVDIGETLLTWGGFNRPIELRARHVRAFGQRPLPIASVPELGIDIAVPALVRGRFAPTRLELVQPQLRVQRAGDGSFAFDIQDAEDTVDAAGFDVGKALLEALSRPPDARGGVAGPLSALVQVSVSGAALMVEDRLTGVSLAVPRADMTLLRDDTGLRADGRLTLDLAGRQAVVETHVHHDLARGLIKARLHFDGIEPAALADLSPALAPLAMAALPLAGTVEVRLDRGFHLKDADFALTGGPGMVHHAALGPDPLAVSFMEVRGRVDPRTPWLAIEDFFIDLGASGQAATEGRRQVRGLGSLALAGQDVQATVHLATAVGDQQGSIDAAAVRHGADGTVTLEAEFDNLMPSRLAMLTPMLAPLGAAALPLSGRAEARLGADLMPLAAQVRLDGGAGTLMLPDLYPEPLPVASVALRARVEQEGRHGVIETATVDLGGPLLSVGATATRDGDSIDLRGDVLLRQMPVDGLKRYWPAPVAAKVRRWVTTNLTEGMVDRAWVAVGGRLALHDPGSFQPTRVDGGLEVAGTTVRYMPTLPPVTHASATATTDGHSFALKIHGGTLRDLKVGGDTTVVISHIGEKQEYIDIDLGVTGPVSTALWLIDHRPLGYASKLDIDPAKARGDADTRLRLYFPLLEDLPLDRVEVGVKSRLRGVALEGILGGLGASDGDLTLVLDVKGMTVKGKAKVGGVPVGVDWRENFTPINGVRSRISARGELGEADRVRLGLDLAPHVVGPVGVDATLVVDARSRQSVRMAVDLTRGRIDLPYLSWDKAPGIPGTATFTLELRDGRIARMRSIAVDSQALKIRGEAELGAGHSLTRLSLSELSAGRSTLSADVRALPGGGHAVRLDGARLDLRRYWAQRDQDETPGKDADKPPLDLSLQLGEVIFGDDGRMLSNVLGEARRTGTGWDRARLDARAAGVPLSLRYTPEGDTRKLELRTEDLGGVLHALDLSDRIKGGRLSVDGQGWPDQPGAPIEGTVVLSTYQVRQAPVLARILNAVSLSGLAELLRGGQGLDFDRLGGSFRWTGDGMHLRQLRTSGGALGLTAEGRIDIDRETLDLQGTIVPVYALNRILGAIPVIGNILSGGEGQGLFAATYHVSGPIGDPRIMVNPLAVLAPGFLRNLFFLGGGESPPSPAPE